MLAVLLGPVFFLLEKHYAVLGRPGSYFPTKKAKKETLKGKCTFLIMERRFFLYDGVTLGAGYSLDWFKERLHQTNRLSNYCRG